MGVSVCRVVDRRLSTSGVQVSAPRLLPRARSGALIDLRGLFLLRRDGAIVFEGALDQSLIDPSSLRPTAVGEVLTRATMQPRTPI